MRKSHLAYLKKAVRLAISTSDKSALLSKLESAKGASGPIYQLVRDVVCDARFYGVTSDTDFWKEYGVAAVRRLIDSLARSGSLDDGKATIEKEEFLNTWLSDHMIPFTDEEERRISGRLKEMATGGSLMFEDSAAGIPKHTTSEFTYGLGIHDKTDSDDAPEPDLPEEVKPLLAGAHSVLAGLPGEWERRERDYLSHIDPSIVEFARKIGRRGGTTGEVKGMFSHAAKSDITGIMTGNDLNRMLPIETALLASPELEGVWLRRYVEKRLQIFSASSSSTRPVSKGNGPIFICIDTSGSMTGDPELTAKRLSLAIAMVAQREHRPLFIVNYSHTLSFFVVTDLQRQAKRLLAFLYRSYSGGNDETKLFRFLFRRLPQSPAYGKYVGILKGADLLIVSDFQWDGISAETKRLIDHARDEGMRLFALGINMGISRRGGRQPDKKDYRSGYDFYDDCDVRYLYTQGFIREV